MPAHIEVRPRARRGGSPLRARAALALSLGLGFWGGPAAVPAGVAQASSPEPQSVEGWIARLGAADAAQRDRAQRWLAANLGAQDLPAVVRALRGGDAEVQRRLADALGSDDRRLGLAAALFQDPRPAVRAAGQVALEQRLASWCAPCTQRGLDRGQVRRALESSPPTLLRLGASQAAPAILLERLARLGGLGVPLAIDPDVRELGPRAQGGGEGSGFALLESLLSTYGLELEGFGFAEPEVPGPTAWLHVTRTGLGGLATGRELLLGAVARVQQGGAEGPSAARFLAATGWPAALAWLEERWLGGDDSALEGLLEAAAQGRVVPSLASPPGQRRVLERADASLAAGAAGARELVERSARGLAATGPLGPRGEDLDAPLLTHAATLPPPALWVRLVALEGRRGGSPGVRGALQDLLRRPDLAPLLRLQAARALAAQAPPRQEGRLAAPAPVGLGELARWAVRTEHGPELAGLAGRLGWDPPAESLEAAASDPHLALLLADWRHARGEGALAAELLTRAASRLEQDPLARAQALRVLGAWGARDGLSATAQLLEEPLERGTADGPLARLAARAGLLSAARQRALFEAIGPAAADPGQLELLGHLAAGWGGAEVRASLLERLADGAALDPARAQALVGSLSAAATALARARQDEALASFLREVWRRAPTTREHPLAALLAPPGWPPRPILARDGLDQLERDLGGILP